MTAPDAKELEQLPVFRGRLKDLDLREEFKTDIFLVRWIRAREGNLDNAESMLRESIKWREENKIDEILDWKCPDIFKTLCNVEFLGYDKENSPIMWLPFGTWNFRQVVSIGETDNLIRYMDWLFVSTLARADGKVMSNGYPVTQFTFLVDFEHFSFRTLASMAVVQMILTCVKRFEANHPETLNMACIINAGRVFQALFAMIKPFLSERTTSKLVILGSDKQTIKSTLAKAFPNDVIPIPYGGESTKLEGIYKTK